MEYTVESDYYATGEGRTMMVWMGLAEDEKNALEKFTKRFDSYHAQGAIVREGFNFDGWMTDMIPIAVKIQLEDQTCNREFYTCLHFNYA